MRSDLHPILRLTIALIRSALGIILLWFGARAILTPFSEMVGNAEKFQLLPGPIITFFVFFLPIFSVLLGTLLFFGLFERLSAFGALGIFILVLTVVVGAWLQKAPVNVLAPFLWSLGFSLAALLIALYPPRYAGLDSLF